MAWPIPLSINPPQLVPRGHEPEFEIATMSYRVKEIYYTLQGEGGQSGRAAVFCRFSNCNLWSGLEDDRPSAVCQFCDTDFYGTDGRRGGEYASETALAQAIAACWPSSVTRCFDQCGRGSRS